MSALSSLLGYAYSDDEEGNAVPEHDQEDVTAEIKSQEPEEDGKIVAYDYEDASLSASGSKQRDIQVADSPPHSPRQRPRSPLWLEQSQDFKRDHAGVSSPNEFSSRRSVTPVDDDFSTAQSVLLPPINDDIDERKSKRQRRDYSAWREKYPLPGAPPAQDLAMRVQVQLEYKRAGKNFLIGIKNRKQLRNPDILDQLAAKCDIIEIGSNFAPDVYDPFQFPAEAFYDALERKQHQLYMKEEEEKRVASMKGARVIDFATASKAGKR